MNKGHLEHNTGQGTKISDGGLRGVAVISGSKIEAVGEYVIAKKEEGNEFSRGGLVLPDEARVKFVVHSIGDGCKDLGLKKGDTLIVATMTEIPIWNPEIGETEMFSVYHKKQVMGVVRA